MVWFLLFSMFFCHIINDYNLQGWLASAKQKDWWIENAPQKLYEYDYIIALIEHAFSWAFMIEIPLFIYVMIVRHKMSAGLFFMVIINTALHAFVDTLKANDKKISLVQDQICHFVQIVLTWLLLITII